MTAPEDILDPGQPIVDPHYHVWDMPGRRHLLDEVLANIRAGHDIRATVFVQCHAMYRADGPPALCPVGETEFATGIAAMSASGIYGPARINAGIVAFADLTLGAAAGAVLDAHARVAGARLKGVRHITAWHADAGLLNPANIVRPGMMAEAGFRAGFAELAPRGLVFDAWLLHPQLDDLAALAAAFPETTIVLNHLGGPIGIGPYAGRRADAFAEWRAGIRTLAARPNVAVKLGGLGMALAGFGFDHATPSSTLAEAWTPYVAECVDAFGAARCMFESNFPVDLATCRYATLWNAFKRIARDASAAERAALFHATATRIYRLAPQERAA